MRAQVQNVEAMTRDLYTEVAGNTRKAQAQRKRLSHFACREGYSQTRYWLQRRQETFNHCTRFSLRQS